MPELGLNPCERGRQVGGANENDLTKLCVSSVDETELYLIRVLTGDPSSYDVPSWTWHAVWSLKVNGGVTPRSFSIKQADVFNSVKGDAHGNLSEIKH